MSGGVCVRMAAQTVRANDIHREILEKPLEERWDSGFVVGHVLSGVIGLRAR